MKLPIPDIQSKLIAQTDAPSSTMLVWVTVAVPNGASFGEMRRALKTIEDIKSNEIYVAHEWTEYDCTGQWSTTHIEKIKRFTNHNGEWVDVIAIFLHHMHCDV